MAMKRHGLTPLQVEVLEWIRAGEPAEKFADDDDLRYRSHARRLEKLGLVAVSGRGIHGGWRLQSWGSSGRAPQVLANLSRTGRRDRVRHPWTSLQTTLHRMLQCITLEKCGVR